MFSLLLKTLFLSLFLHLTFAKNMEDIARELVQSSNNEFIQYQAELTLADYHFHYHTSKENVQRFAEATLKYSNFKRTKWAEFSKFNWQKFTDEKLKRQFIFAGQLGDLVLPSDHYKEYQHEISTMQVEYATLKICQYTNPDHCTLSTEDVIKILETSSDPEELKYYWIEWRKNLGPKIKPHFLRYLGFMNEIAKLNNVSSAADVWLEPYLTPNLKEQIKRVWYQLQPMYQQLHAYVRYCLKNTYEEKAVNEQNPIPMHLLGDVWGQSFDSLANISMPYPNKPVLRYDTLYRNYTAEGLFKLAEDFVVSMGLPNLPQSFWNNSIFTKPLDRPVICSSKTFSVASFNDHRVIICNATSDFNFFLLSHETVGFMMYPMCYKDQPFHFQNSASPAFTNTIAQLFSMSAFINKAFTYRHGSSMKAHSIDPDQSLNNLFVLGLHEIPFLPFSYLLDTWRWAVFSKEISTKNLNCKWWEMVTEIQGIEPPVDRSENDFDPATKIHVVASIPYIDYFIGTIQQYQVHKALCIDAGLYDPKKPTGKPLHECTLSGNLDAGEKLKNFMSYGRSKPWPDLLEFLTKEKKLNALPLLEFFRPLTVWLEKKNKDLGINVGWKGSTKKCIT